MATKPEKVSQKKNNIVKKRQLRLIEPERKIRSKWCEDTMYEMRRQSGRTKKNERNMKGENCKKVQNQCV